VQRGRKVAVKIEQRGRKTAVKIVQRGRKVAVKILQRGRKVAVKILQWSQGSYRIVAKWLQSGCKVPWGRDPLFKADNAPHGVYCKRLAANRILLVRSRSSYVCSWATIAEARYQERNDYKMSALCQVHRILINRFSPFTGFRPLNMIKRPHLFKSGRGVYDTTGVKKPS
jgi:hypothetical protein